MLEETAEHLPLWHGLAALQATVSSKKLHALLKHAGDVAHAWDADTAMLTAAEWTEEQQTRFFEHRQRWNPEREWQRLQETQISLLPFSATAFPALLRTIYDPPIALYVRGTLPQEGITIAVVGSRKATPYGKTATNMLVRPLASRGLTIISGLAYGIDAEAHRATLGVRGRTIAVLGSGVDDPSLYPRAHRQLAADIIGSGGAVISEYAPGTRPQTYYFPQRNRIIAGMSKALLIVEASAKSGALITARLALDQGRDVFAVPGPITSESSEGTNGLLRDGAAPICRPEDLLDLLALRDVLPASRAEKEPMFQEHATGDDGPSRLLAQLSGTPRGVDEIIGTSTLPPNVVSSLLTVLELDGRIRDVGNKQYVRI